MIFLDTESIGLVGPTMTIQHAGMSERPSLHLVWEEKARNTLALIERIVDSKICAFNLTHDWFHIQRLYCILKLLPPGRLPTPDGWCRVEKRATEGPCLKPKDALDVYLHAIRGPWQSLMDRKDVKIRRVPAALAPLLADWLTENVSMEQVYFTKRPGGECKWQVDPKTLKEDPDFPDVILKFGASAGLKPLARNLLKVDAPDIPIPDDYFPDEQGWNPFGRNWLPVFKKHRDLWRSDQAARKYALDDVDLLYRLWTHFGKPAPGDDDSVLACQVASARWRGYAVDLEAATKLRKEAEYQRESVPERNAPAQVLTALHGRMSSIEAMAVNDTRGTTLDEIAGIEVGGRWVGGWSDNRQARDYARRVVRARSAEKTVDYCRKLEEVGRGHPSFRIRATLSNRMGGSDGFNWQGLPDSVKEVLTLADGDLPLLVGGDFSSFEVSLAAAVYKDEGLIRDLSSGKKMHALFGADMYGVEYEDLYNDETGHEVDKDRYDRAKRGFFGKMYGAQDPKLATTLGIVVAEVAPGTRRFEARYPGVAAARERIAGAFCSMQQPMGLGTRVVWKNPAEYVDSLFGARRYYSLENRIERALFDLANSMPSEFRKLKVKVSRRIGRLQTPGGACQSAIFAAAFNLQARAMRSAANHEIQASGATITKHLQRRIWDRQPCGIHPWVCQPLNEHDSLMVPTRHATAPMIEDTVETVVSEFKGTVPLLKIKWKKLERWGDK